MRKLLTLLLVVFAVTTATAQKQKTNQKAVIQTKIVCDHCKECENLRPIIPGKLLGINGVKMIDIDSEKMTITVFYSTKTNLDAIRTAISKMGYDADDVKADPLGYEKLDGCCKLEG